jgi:hypothetical protein
VPPPANVVHLLDVIRRQRSTRWVRLPVGGGPIRLWRGLFPDGSSVVLKEGESRHLGREIGLYEAVKGPFLPRLVAADAGMGFLALEDLSDFDRPLPWTPRAVELVLGALDAAAAAPPPPGLPTAAGRAIQDGWRRVAADPGPTLALFVCSERWLQGALPVLQEAEAAAVVEGHALLHMNVRPENLLVGPERAVLLDWRHAAIGAPALDRAMLAVGIAAEGGARPEEIVGDAPELAAAIAGWFASQAGRRDGHPAIRAFQFDQLTASLPWAARALGLPDPLGGGACFGGLGRSS